MAARRYSGRWSVVVAMMGVLATAEAQTRLQWYTRSTNPNTRSINTWNAAVSFCAARGTNARLCTLREICIGGDTGRVYGGRRFSGDQWSPYSGDGSNAWVQTGTAHRECEVHHGSGRHGRPGWGTQSGKNNYEANYVLCAFPVTPGPTRSPTRPPTRRPTTRPTAAPTWRPTANPTDHPCTAGTHICDPATTACGVRPSGQYVCDCRPGHIPILGVSTRCAATDAPTVAPTTRPTANPTAAPTRHPCGTQLHGCDVLTSYCLPGYNGTYSCSCRAGYMRSNATAFRCVPWPAPTSAPTRPTPVPTMEPTLHPCRTQNHGCDLLTTVCGELDQEDYECICRAGYVTDPRSSLRCVAAPLTTEAPTTEAPATPAAVAGGAEGSGSGDSVLLLVVVVLAVLLVVTLIVALRQKSDKTAATTAAAAKAEATGRPFGGGGFANPLYMHAGATASGPEDYGEPWDAGDGDSAGGYMDVGANAGAP